MDFKSFDRARRNAAPLELDLIESFAQGKVSRRAFIKRGTIIGLSAPLMATIISACSSDAKTATTTAAGATTTVGGATTTVAPKVAAGGTIKIAIQTPAGPLDPIKMADLGSYGIVAQSFEFLATLGDDGDIAPGLAESWKPNADGSVWTFKIRKGVKWQKGGELTVDDIAATMDRLVDAKNAGLNKVIGKGAVKAIDPLTAEFTLLSPNGNFPYLVSVFNAQSLITPKGYVAGTTLDKEPNGTGPFKLVKYDAATGATFTRNDDWWGGKTPLDGTQFIFSEKVATQVAGMAGNEVDAIVQFSSDGGEVLLNDPNFNLVAARTSSHRQIWMNTREGQFVDKRVRQALALSLDRDQYVQTLFKGKADVGNDHPVAPLYPFYDDSVPQRKKDIAKAKQLLVDAGGPKIKATLHCGELQEIPKLAALVQTNLKEIGFDITLNVESQKTFYDEWCKTYDPICDGGQELGIVDYGHRSVPDVYLNAAYATGTWNSAHYKSEPFNAAFAEYQKALDVAGHKAACKKLETIANEDVPYAIPYFYTLLSGHSKKFTGLRWSALGQLFLDKAATTA